MIAPTGSFAEFSGGSNLPAAAELTALQPVDMTIVRGAIPESLARDIARQALAEHPPEPFINIVEAIYNAIPQLTEVDAFVGQWWAEQGYTDYALDNTKMSADKPKTLYRFPPHFDGYENRTFDKLYGPLVLSVLAKETSLYRALRFSFSFTDEERQFDPIKFMKAANPYMRSCLKNGGTRVTQEPTDIALFMAHPTASVHSVKRKRGLGPIGPRRVAYILDHGLKKIPNEV